MGDTQCSLSVPLSMSREHYVQGSTQKPVKRTLVGPLQGSFLKLAQLGAASRLSESVFVWRDSADKYLIAEELADHLTGPQVRCALSLYVPHCT
jgi:hypothetical protein